MLYNYVDESECTLGDRMQKH